MARPQGLELNRTAWDDVVVGIKCLTVTEVAEMAGVNRASVSTLICGHTRASLKMARQISDAVGLQVATLFPDHRRRAVDEAAA